MMLKVWENWFWLNALTRIETITRASNRFMYQIIYNMMVYFSFLILTCVYNLCIAADALNTKLQCLEVPVLSDWDCKYCYQTNNMFCAGFLEGGRDCWVT